MSRRWSLLLFLVLVTVGSALLGKWMWNSVAG
jgi:hypothetical protein